MKVFSHLFQREEGNYDEIAKVTFVYSLLFKKLITIAEKKESRSDFMFILKVFIRPLNVVLQLDQLYYVR